MTAADAHGPIGSADVSDPRVRRTRSRLTAALVELAAERDLDDITLFIQEFTAG